MSWMTRPEGGAPPPGPARQPYPAPQAQPIGNQQNMYHNYEGGGGGGGGGGGAAQQPQYWQAPPPPQQQAQYGPQYGQAYQQQDYPNNANQFYQQPNQYNQNYTNQGYGAPPQSYPQNYPQNQGQQPNFIQKPNDGWEENWDWGWEDSSKQGQKVPPSAMQHVVQQPPSQQQVFNNANIIEESFATTDSWNWAMDENKDARTAPARVQPLQENKEPPTLPVSNPLVENNTVPELSTQRRASNISAQHTEEMRTLNDREVVKEHLPNLALGKRFHLDNLTPQWSIESQMSQESSDGPHTHSEGTYRSENPSRNSSKSSPGLNTDNSNFNYSQVGLEEGYPQNSEWSRPSNELTLSESIQNDNRRESHDELSSSLQEMNIANHENPSIDNASVPVGHGLDSRDIQENVSVAQPPPPASPASFPPPVTSNIPPPTMSSKMPPPPPVSSVSMQSPASLSAALSFASLPPPNLPPASSHQNPFKHAGQFSHKSIAKGTPSASTTSVQSFPPQLPTTNLTSPAVITKASQQTRAPVGFEANLETTPDNSERPDQPHMSAFRPTHMSQEVPDNMEVAPRNDRNEYLQTAHLSSGDYGENTDFSRNAPPPGFRRMVVGQQESEYNQALNISGDEPPPGLARMVPGQQTEAETAYNQSSDNYMDRHIDGQPTDTGARPYRQADGQQTPDNYTQQAPSRVTERRPIGLDRMVPGEPSNDEYPQYPTPNYGGANEQRVVTGVDHDYPMPTDAGPTDVREQNVDGSDYSAQSSRNPPRNVIGAGESSGAASPDYGAPRDDQQRELTMEGENLHDLSVISSTELAYSREQALDGADLTFTDVATDRKTDLSDSVENRTTSSRRQSLNRVNTSGEDSERDRAFKASPRRDRDKHKSSRDRDWDRDKDRERDKDKEGRYSRGDKKYDRDERKVGRDERRPDKERREREREWERERERDGHRERRDREREREESPEARRARRSTRSHRYETEDTDYSDRERDRRRRREGSYTSSKPPRPDDKDRRHEGRERGKRYATIERDRRYDDERDGRRGDKYRDRYERSYRDIDPSRKYGNLRRQRDKDERDRRVVTFSSDAKTNDSCINEGEPYSPSRAESREATATDEDAAAPAGEPRRRERRARHERHERHARTADPFYDEYVGGVGGGGVADPYLAQRQQYQYYEQLRLADPAAYMLVYKQLMAGRAPPVPLDYRAQHYADGFMSISQENRREERGSVHSGRSSTAGLRGNETYYGAYGLEGGAGAGSVSLRGAPSLRTDVSDRELTTDMSLNLHLEESTVRSERMTPFRYSTAHVKGSISSRDVVVVRPLYPVDGAPAAVQVLALAALLPRDAAAAELAAFPGPLLRGVSHKKSVMEYCSARMRGAAREGARDPRGYVLLWDLLALLLRQNGVVVGTDIAELLMKNAREHEHEHQPPNKQHNGSRCESGASGEGSAGSGAGGRQSPARPAAPATPLDSTQQESASGAEAAGADAGGAGAAGEGAALERLREYLIYGNRQDALEWAMSQRLWGHALQLAALGDRRARASVAARFLAALPRTDPLHTLYSALAQHTPPAATCVADARWGDWRPHAAVLLANASARPDHDTRNITRLGDSLLSRGLVYSAQFCYLSAGVQFARHPLAPLGAPAATAGAAAGAGAGPPRLALLLADSRADSLPQLATNRAIFATEVYEYALSLSQEDYVIDELQVYKYMVAVRLVDCGQYERALAYAEAAARAVTRAPRRHAPALAARLADLADRLKYHDPALQEGLAPAAVGAGEAEGEAGSAEPSPRHHQQWLDDVKGVAHMLTAEAAAAAQAQASPRDDYYGGHQYAWSDQAQQYHQQSVPAYAEPAKESPEYPAQYYAPPAPAPEPPPAPAPAAAPAAAPPYAHDEWPRPEEPAQSYADPYWHTDHYGYGEAGEGGAGAGAGAARPAITMPGAGYTEHAGYPDYDDDRPPSADRDRDRDQQTERETDTGRSEGSGAGKKQEGGKEGARGEGKGKGGGWLGGILTKLSLRPPNQMILPDDKNPTIVWDAENKRWRNMDGDSDEAERPPPPPPRAADLPHALPQPQLGGGGGAAPAQAAALPAAGAAPPVSNIFKMQKGRHIKKSYVDVFNPSGAATRPLPPAPEVLGPAPPPAAPPTYFVPQPHAHRDTQHSVRVSMPSSPPATPRPSPRRASTPSSPPPSDESGMYDPAQMSAADDEPFRSGI